MTLEEALRFIDQETDMDALAEVEYYGGFKGKERAAQKRKKHPAWSLTLFAAYRGTMPKPRRLSTMKAGRTREKSTAAS